MGMGGGGMGGGADSGGPDGGPGGGNTGGSSGHDDRNGRGTGNPGKGNTHGVGAMSNGRNEGRGDNNTAPPAGHPDHGLSGTVGNPEGFADNTMGNINWATNVARKVEAFGNRHRGLVGLAISTINPLAGLGYGFLSKAGIIGGPPSEGNTGGSAGGDRNDVGIAGLGLGGNTEAAIAARSAREIPRAGPRTYGSNVTPTYAELQEQFSRNEIAPGSESYANPNLFSYGTEAYRYDPTSDSFTSVYSGERISNDLGQGGLASL